MDVVCGIDSNYVIHCAVMLTSLLEHNQLESVTIHVLSLELREADRTFLTSTASKYGASINFYELDAKFISQYPVFASEHISLAAYNRLFVADLLPGNLNKCLYLDSDMIVRDPLAELYGTDLEDNLVGAVIDQSGDDVRHYNRLGIEGGIYFNSGVLLINLEAWRQSQISKLFLGNLVVHRQKILHHDQDLLNITCYGRVKQLPMKYNVQLSFFYRNPYIALKRWEEMFQACRKPVICHYTNKLKPWHYGCLHPYSSDYKKYYKLLFPEKSFRLCDYDNHERWSRIVNAIKKLVLGNQRSSLHSILRSEFL